MSLPSALVQFAEQHPCFTGCYSGDSNVAVFTGATLPALQAISVSCQECFAKIGVAASLLPVGLHSYQLANQLSEHIRIARGYSLSVSGYHAAGPGFWFSAVYWTSCKIFVLDGERSRNLGTDLDLLMLAFQHRVLTVPDPGMLLPTAFTTQPIYQDPQVIFPKIVTKADLLKTAGISTQPKKGCKKLTLAEFVSTPANAAALASAPAVAPVPALGVPASTGVPLCPKCGAEVRERMLLQRTYVGCLC